MHRTRKLILALLALAVLIAAAVLVLRPKEDPSDEAPTEESTTIYSVAPGALTGLSWSWGDTQLSLVKETELWSCGTAPDAEIDQATVASLVELAASVPYTKALDETAEPSEFGFDAPRLRLRLYLGDTTGELQLGLRNDFLQADYARWNEGPIYLIDTALYDAFAVELQHLVPQDSIPSLNPSNTFALKLQSPERARILRRTEESDFFPWQEDGGPVETASVRSLLTTLSGLKLTDCVAYRPESLAVYGLAEPSLTVSAAGDDGAVTVEFGDYTTEEELLGSDPEALEDLDEPEAPERFVYVRLDGSELVYTAPASAMESLREALDSYLGPTKVTSADWASLRALRLSVDGLSHRIGIDKFDETDDEGNVTTTTVYDIDGAESDYDTVYAFYKQLSQMETNTLPEPAEPQGEAFLTAELHRDSNQSAVVTVRFYPWDNAFYLVQADGQCRLIVSRRDVEALADAVRALG